MYVLKAACIFPDGIAKRVKQPAGVAGERFGFPQAYGNHLVAMRLAGKVEDRDARKDNPRKDNPRNAQKESSDAKGAVSEAHDGFDMQDMQADAG